MIRLSVVIVVIALTQNQFASGDAPNSPRALLGDQTPTDDAARLLEGPLFDFPITRALGIDVRTLTDAPAPRPGVYDLAEDKPDDVEAAEAPVVYYDVPPSHARPRSMWR